MDTPTRPVIVNLESARRRYIKSRERSRRPESRARAKAWQQETNSKTRVVAGNHYRRYTPEETRDLVEMINQGMGCEEAALRLRRTMASVACKLHSIRAGRSPCDVAVVPSQLAAPDPLVTLLREALTALPPGELAERIRSALDGFPLDG